jgi:Transglycosylase SLT domain
MARESVFDVDLGLDDAVKQLERSRDLVREISEANSKNLDVTDKVKNQYKEINDSLAKQRLEMARMSADFAEQLKAMQVSGLSQDEINAAKQKFQNEKDIAKLAEESLANQRKALSDDFSVKKKQEEDLSGWRLHLFKKTILSYRQLTKQASRLSLDEMLFDAGRWSIGAIGTIAKIGLGAIATGALGGVAFGAMASSGSEERKRAMGLGVSVPEMQALRHVYKSIYDDPESTLSRIYGMQRDPKKATDLSLLLRNNPRFDTAKEIGQASSFELASILPTEIKKRLDQIDKLTGGNKFLQSSYYSMFGLGDFSQSDLARIGKLSYKELASEQRNIPSALARENISDKTLLQWQQAQEKFGLSGQAIENTFLTTLTKLAPQLGKLSEGITDVIKAVGKSPVVATAIDKTANALGRFTKYLDSGEATSEITGFLESLDVGAGYVYSFADGIGVAGRAIGLLDERSLKGSEYRKISAIRGINKDFSELLRESEENPSDIAQRNKAIYEFGKLSNKDKASILSASGGVFSDVLSGKVTSVRSWKGGFLDAMSSGGVAGDFVSEQVSDFKNWSGKGGKKTGRITSIYDAQFAAMGAKYGINPELLKAQAYSESGLNPNAVSPVGAVGLSQFMPGTADRFGLKNRRDPIASIEAQAKYMHKLLGMFGGDTEKALAGYNWGENRKTIRKGTFSDLPKETKNYINRINELMHSGKISVQPQPKPRPQVVSVKVDINAGHGMDAAAQMQRVR